MNSMRKRLFCGFLGSLLGSGAWAADKSLSALSTNRSTVQHGRYLVENLGGCGDCHSPTLQNGEPDKTHWLKGAMLVFQPIQPIPHWKAASPDITPTGPKWQKWGEAGFVKFLETGAWPDGDKADPPMPAFHLNSSDARAIVAYLKTLK